MGVDRLTSLKPGDLLIGKNHTVNLGEELGRTPAVTVFEAGMNRAVKVFDTFPDLSRDERSLGRRRIEREATIHQGLVHPNIHPFGYLDETTEGPFIEMERAWSTLSDIMKSGDSPHAQLHAVLTQVARAVTFIHGNDIIHRDLKPANVFLGHAGAQLGDFGIAIDRNQAPLENDISLGTPAFTSPERYHGAKGDERSEVWSFGAMAFWVLSGMKYPYVLPPKPSVTDYYNASQIQIPLHLRDVLAHDKLPTPWQKAWEPVLFRMLAKDPKQRYPDFEQVLAVLEEIRVQAEVEEGAADAVIEKEVRSGVDFSSSALQSKKADADLLSTIVNK